MENASKALIIAASVLITVMLFSIMWYIFGKTARMSGMVEEGIGEEQLEAFNSKFVGFETLSTITDSFNDDDLRKKASKELNNISDVLTAVNLAYNINYVNNNSYRYDNFEKVNTVEIKIDLSKVWNDFQDEHGVHLLKKYYFLEPCKTVKQNCIYGIDDPNTFYLSKTNRINKFTSNGRNISPEFEELDLYRWMLTFNRTKTAKFDNKEYTLYRYYFLGSYEINKETQKIDSVTFTAIRDNGF